MLAIVAPSFAQRAPLLADPALDRAGTSEGLHLRAVNGRNLGTRLGEMPSWLRTVSPEHPGHGRLFGAIRVMFCPHCIEVRQVRPLLAPKGAEQ